MRQARIKYKLTLMHSIQYIEKRYDFSKESWHSVVSKLNLKTKFSLVSDFEKIIGKINNPNLKIDMNILFDKVVQITDCY